MKKIQNKLKNDNDGANPLITLVVIIIVGLLIWQFVLPLFTDIPSFYSVITNESEPDELDITASWQMFNSISGIKYDVPQSPNTIYYSSVDSYSVIVTSNVPYKLTNPYYIRIIISELVGSEYQIISSLTQAIPYSALYSDTFTYGLDLDLTGSTVYEIQTDILDAEYNRMPIMWGNIYVEPEP